MADDPWAEFRIKGAPSDSTNIPVNTPNVPPRGEPFSPNVMPEMEEVNPIVEYGRQQKVESARRQKESDELTAMQGADRKQHAERGANATKLRQVVDVLDKLEDLPATQNIHTGPLSEIWLKAGQIIKDVFPGAPESIFHKDQSISSAEALQKLGIILSTQSTKELTSRPAVFEFMKNLEASPGMSVRPETRKILTGILRTEADKDIELGKHALRARDYYDFVKEKDRVNEDPKYKYQFPDEFKSPTANRMQFGKGLKNRPDEEGYIKHGKSRIKQIE